MSLRTDYTGGLDTAFNSAIAAGNDFVTSVPNLAVISVAMAAAVVKGEKDFTYTGVVSFQPEDLRLEGPLWEAFKSGVLEGLASESILQTEVTITLNTSDQLTTKVDIAFSF